MPSEPLVVFIQKGAKRVEELHNFGLEKKHTVNILKSFQESGELVVDDLKKVIGEGNRTGRVYSFRGFKYIASAPGEPPANRSGRLMNSFGYNRTPKTLQIYNRAFSDRGAPYPFFLENGTSKMQPRPYFISTIEKRGEDLRNKLLNLKKED